MSNSPPLASPTAWNAVAEAYALDFLPLFEHYARSAMELAQLSDSARILDVATGPGTLPLLAAGQVASVSAVDFAADMVAVCRRRLLAAGVENVEVQQADGQSLPFAGDLFDADFSLFGLMFFPDRAAGFMELLRVLKPGGRAVVAAWAPASEAPLLATMFNALGEFYPSMAFGRGDPPPLSDPDRFRSEMSAAGFSEVNVHTVRHKFDVPSVEQFWETQQRASAPVVLLRSNTLAAQWEKVSATVLERLQQQLGSGMLSLEWPARMGVEIR